MVHILIIFIQSHWIPVCAGSWVITSEDSQITARLIYPSFPNRSSAVIAIGAATLADIFEPSVRGQKVG